MPSAPLLKPDLYTATDRPALLGGRCTCGHVFFPMQTYGCEKCGRHGNALAPFELAGEGELIASAQVHMHAGKGRDAPFTVCAVRLKDGPMVRTLLVEGAEDLEPGTKMVAVLVPVASEEGGRLDLRFEPAG